MQLGENVPLKQQKATSLKKEKKEKGWETVENSARERGAKFGGTNNTLVAISLEYTIGSCCVLDILFLSHYSTNGPEGFEGT